MDDLTTLGTSIGSLTPLVTAITGFIMKFTPQRFDKERYAPLVSLAAGLIASVMWQTMNPVLTWPWTIIRGVLVGLGGSALWDLYKSGKAMGGK